jgi:hypothetical protein
MAHIEIFNLNNLNIAGSDLLTDADSFLTELKDTDATQVMGGGGSKGGKSFKKKSGKGGYGYYGGYGGYCGCCYTSD